jgi:hypothetical protein
MKNIAMGIVVAAGLALTPRAWAEEPEAAPAAAMPGMEAPAKAETPKPESPKPAPAAEKPAPACLLTGPAAAGVGCTKAYRALADGYLEAYKTMDSWLAQAASEASAQTEHVAKLEQVVRDNEAAMTGLKLDRSKEAKLKLKELDKANKQAWKELEDARKTEATLCKGFARSAAQKVKELTAGLAQKLADAQKAGQ